MASSVSNVEELLQQLINTQQLTTQSLNELSTQSIITDTRLDSLVE